LVIIDDLNRPTPVARVMPFLLKHFQEAGISPGHVTVLVATGTHGPPFRMDTLLRKVGPEAAAACRILVHDPTRNLAQIGKTSFGTPVAVNKEILASDFVVGMGGVYPNHTAGFGGGSKLALGILGTRPIMHLHYRHQGVGWGSGNTESEFRKDLDEIARIVGLHTILTLHVNANRELVRMTCGDYFRYYREEVAFCRQVFNAPLPENAEVVVSNAYPNDLSLTFVRKKGITPLRHCSPGVSRIVIASCSEGVGYHGLFPFVNRPRFHRQKQLVRRLSVLGPRDVARKIWLRLRRTPAVDRGDSRTHQRSSQDNKRDSALSNPIQLYRPGCHSQSLPSHIPGMRLSSTWPEILEAIRREQEGKKHLNVLVYPCAPLQCLDELHMSTGLAQLSGVHALEETTASATTD
jgi:hypothetical protein